MRPRSAGIYRQFACPQVARYDLTGEAIAVAHGTAAVEMLLERERPVIIERSRGLVELLEDWLAGSTDFETVWDISFGRVVRALESREVNAVDVLAEVALRLMARGSTGEWTAALEEERRLNWDGQWLFPTASRVPVESDGSAATVTLTESAGGVWTTVLTRRGSTDWTTDHAAPLSEVGVRRKIGVFPSNGVPRDMVFEDDFHSIFDFPPVTEVTTQAISRAFDPLDRYAPNYLEWVERVLRGVLVCRCQESRTRSSSWMHAPGMILVSASPNPIEVAEMLVHESSHQYYYLASRLGAMVDESDKRVYYSPAVQRSRPLGKILIGYHAFANVLLFYRTLLTNGLADDAYCIAMEDRLDSDVEALEEPLRDNPALTDLGRDLCNPLIEQLATTRSSQVR